MRNFLVLFSATFLIRSVALVLTSRELWPIFHDWYCEGLFNVWWSLVFVFELLLYNIIPITHLSAVHYKNFKKEDNWEEEQVHQNAFSETVSLNQSVFTEEKGFGSNMNSAKQTLVDTSLRTSKGHLTYASHLDENSVIVPRDILGKKLMTSDDIEAPRFLSD